MDVMEVHVMHRKRNSWLALVILAAISLASCNIGKAAAPTPDVNAVFTSAAQTMVAQLSDQQTQTAQAIPTDTPTGQATFTPLPTFPVNVTPFGAGTPFTFNTPTPGGSGISLTPLALPTVAGGLVGGFAVGCANAVFAGETIPDKTVITPGKSFEKAWMMYNAGTCTWDQGFRFSFKSGDKLNGNDILISQKDDFTAPGHSITFIVNMKAPMTAREYIGYWQMKTDQGVWFGSLVSVDVIVKK